jgi:hypothetical protein
MILWEGCLAIRMGEHQTLGRPSSIFATFSNAAKLFSHIYPGGVGDTAPRKLDGLLWDYGMHHLHLRRIVDTDGFVERSDWLLFAIVTGQAKTSTLSTSGVIQIPKTCSGFAKAC